MYCSIIVFFLADIGAITPVPTIQPATPTPARKRPRGATREETYGQEFDADSDSSDSEDMGSLGNFSLFTFHF